MASLTYHLDYPEFQLQISKLKFHSLRLSTSEEIDSIMSTSLGIRGQFSNSLVWCPSSYLFLTRWQMRPHLSSIAFQCWGWRRRWRWERAIQFCRIKYLSTKWEKLNDEGYGILRLSILSTVRNVCYRQEHRYNYARYHSFFRNHSYITSLLLLNQMIKKVS